MRKCMSLMRHVFMLVLLSIAVRAQAQPESAEDFLDRARDHMERRRFLNALESLRVTLQMSEDKDARVYAPKREAELLAAECLKELGRVDEAANMYERADKHGYNDKKVTSYLALYFDRRRDDTRALEYFERYYAADKTDIPVHISYAALLGRLKDREKARQILEGSEPKAIAQKTADCEKLEKEKKYRDAAGCYLKLRDARPDKEQNYLALYRLAVQLHDRKLTSEYAHYLYFIFGNDTRHIWPLVELKLSQRKFYEARFLLEEIISAKGKDSDAERLLVNLQNSAGPALAKPFRATHKEMLMMGK